MVVDTEKEVCSDYECHYFAAAAVPFAAAAVPFAAAAVPFAAAAAAALFLNFFSFLVFLLSIRARHVQKCSSLQIHTFLTL